MNSRSFGPRNVLAVVCALVLVACALAAEQPGARAVLQSAEQRKPAPEFALQDSSGKTVHLNEYRGKIVVLDFWATWCHGCKQEIPWFVEFDRNYRNKGLAVVGISMDEMGGRL